MAARGRWACSISAPVDLHVKHTHCCLRSAEHNAIVMLTIDQENIHAPTDVATSGSSCAGELKQAAGVELRV